MSVRRSLVKGVAVVGAVGAWVLSVRRVLEDRAAVGFYEHGLPRTEPRRYGSAYGGAPLMYHRAEGVQTFHAADFDAVRAALPTERLHPVRTRDGRAIVVVSGYQYHAITANGVDGLALLPYAALTIGALVSRRPAPPVVPFFAPAFTGLAAGAFLFHMLETSRAPVDAGASPTGSRSSWPTSSSTTRRGRSDTR